MILRVSRLPGTNIVLRRSRSTVEVEPQLTLRGHSAAITKWIHIPSCLPLSTILVPNLTSGQYPGAGLTIPQLLYSSTRDPSTHVFSVSTSHSVCKHSENQQLLGGEKRSCGGSSSWPYDSRNRKRKSMPTEVLVHLAAFLANDCDSAGVNL